MAAIKGWNTKPELTVRRALHALGFRFRLHRKDLPGKPDVVLPKYKTVILVHGCFWHQHPGCRMTATPKSRVEFWNAKLQMNVQRDKRTIAALNELGWRVVVIWQCETRDVEVLRKRLVSTLRGG